MKNLLAILKATEGLLERAERNLGKLDGIKFDEDTETIVRTVQPILERNSQVKSILFERKERMLSFLFKVALLTKKTCVEYGPWGNGQYTYELRIISETTVINGFRSSTREPSPKNIREFLEEHPHYFFEICNNIIKQIKNFFEEISDSQRKQSKEIAELEDLANELTRMFRQNIN